MTLANFPVPSFVSFSVNQTLPLKARNERLSLRRKFVLWRSKLYSTVPRKAVVGGMASGGFGQFLASPTDLVKVQMQMEGRRILEGKSPRYKWPLEIVINSLTIKILITQWFSVFMWWFYVSFRYRGTAHAFSSIVRKNGFTGLWKGWLPNVQRAALVNLGGR